MGKMDDCCVTKRPKRKRQKGPENKASHNNPPPNLSQQ